MVGENIITALDGEVMKAGWVHLEGVMVSASTGKWEGELTWQVKNNQGRFSLIHDTPIHTTKDNLKALNNSSAHGVDDMQRLFSSWRY